MLDEVDSVVTRARMFTHKPDGQFTILKLQDADGIPIPVMQDPLHYPHGTKFLAPGMHHAPSHSDAVPEPLLILRHVERCMAFVCGMMSPASSVILGTSVPESSYISCIKKCFAWLQNKLLL